jgi:hypothetical protein
MAAVLKRTLKNVTSVSSIIFISLKDKDSDDAKL